MLCVHDRECTFKYDKVFIYLHLIMFEYNMGVLRGDHISVLFSPVSLISLPLNHCLVFIF